MANYIGQGILNMPIFMDEFAVKFQDAWLSRQQVDLYMEDIDFKLSLTPQPFRMCVVDNLIEIPRGFGDELLSELSDVRYFEKDSDIFQFSQSVDLKTCGAEPGSCIETVCEFFSNDIRKWVKRGIGQRLHPNIDISCSRYGFKDYLLCHDDRGGDHNIAFVWYLTKEWNTYYGGSLDLFSATVDGNAKEIVKQVFPAWNRLVFFEVSPTSFHQVSEILTQEQIRVSINGWFNWKHIRLNAPSEIVEIVQTPTPNYMPEFMRYINQRYLSPPSGLNDTFVGRSFVNLNNFVKPNIYQIMEEEIVSENITWVPSPNLHSHLYEVAATPYDQHNTELGPMLYSFTQFLISKFFCGILNQICGLEMDISPVQTETGEEGTLSSYIRLEIRRYKPGSYSFIVPYDKSRVIANFFLLPPTDSFINGGSIVFADKHTKAKKLVRRPSRNAFLLVFAESEFGCYLKYRSKLSDQTFYSISVVYDDCKSTSKKVGRKRKAAEISGELVTIEEADTLSQAGASDEEESFNGASDEEESFNGASDQEESIHGTSDQEESFHETSDQEESFHETSDQEESIFHDASDQDESDPEVQASFQEKLANIYQLINEQKAFQSAQALREAGAPSETVTTDNTSASNEEGVSCKAGASHDVRPSRKSGASREEVQSCKSGASREATTSSEATTSRKSGTSREATTSRESGTTRQVRRKFIPEIPAVEDFRRASRVTWPDRQAYYEAGTSTQVEDDDDDVIFLGMVSARERQAEDISNDEEQPMEEEEEAADLVEAEIEQEVRAADLVETEMGEEAAAAVIVVNMNEVEGSADLVDAEEEEEEEEITASQVVVIDMREVVATTQLQNNISARENMEEEEEYPTIVID